jgi:hypothetical protein
MYRVTELLLNSFLNFINNEVKTFGNFLQGRRYKTEIMDALFPLQETLLEEQVAQAHESIKTLANPRPLPMVTDAQ